jgi:3-dehydroquinate synthase
LQLVVERLPTLPASLRQPGFGGVEWYAFPTTLAAMVDASIGGKTGINTAAGKNLVGSFFTHQLAWSLIQYSSTPFQTRFCRWFAEVIKTGLIADVKILDLLEGCATLAAARAHSLELIERSARVKADVVSKDFKEGKLREILNFGHTFGHAVERSTNYQLRHGEAVSIGSHLRSSSFGVDVRSRARGHGTDESSSHAIRFASYAR